MTADTLSLLQSFDDNPPPSLANFDTGNINHNNPPFILVDGSYYLFRCFFGMPPLSNKEGLPTNAVRGVLNALNKLIKKYQPTHMAIAFDTKSPTFRHQLSETYKADRPPMDPDLAVQIPYIHTLIKVLGIPLIALEGYEADDIIGTLAYRACQLGHRVVISTGDKDMAQLVNSAVILEDSFKGVITDIDGVMSKFGVNPNQIIDYLTLMGDASDGIMGVPKVGKKTAATLLGEYGNLDNILKNADNIKGVVGQNIKNSTEQITLDKQLASIVTNLDLPYQWEDLKLYQHCDDVQLLQLYEQLEFAKERRDLQKKLANTPKPKETNNNANANINSATNATDLDNNSDIPSLIKLESIATNYHTITNPSEFEALIKQLYHLPYFAIDTETTSLDWQQAQLVGISIATTLGEAYYIPLMHKDDLGNLLPNQLDYHMVITALRPILQNPAIGKIGQNLKYDSHILQNLGVDLIGQIHLDKAANNWQMDTMLASYVINAAATRHNMDSLAQHYLGIKTTTFEDIAGRGTKQLSFDKIALDTASHYACEDADITYRLFWVFNEHLKRDQIAHKLVHQIEIPIAQILTHMERTGILVHRKFLMELSARFDKEILTLQNNAHAIADTPFNLASPKQLGEILFDKLGIKGGKKTKTGQYSTSEATLSKINHPLVDTVLEYRSLSKLKSTYTDALDKAADKNGRIHTSYHQALTSTGRLSSSDPNLQNIPIRTDTGRLIREAFIAPKGRVIVAADYSQIELRLMAHFSGDQGLIDAFTQGIDIHTKTASEILGKAIEDISPSERRSAKAVNFGLLYGMGQFGLAKQLGISNNEAKTYIERYFASYPTIYDYMEHTKETAVNLGYVQTILRRKIFMPDITSTNRTIKEAAMRAAINAPLQGSAADIIKLAMIAVHKILPADQAVMLLQVHDELVFEVDKTEADTIGTLIKNAMQNVLSDTATKMGFEVNLSVPLIVDIGMGDNWEQAH